MKPYTKCEFFVYQLSIDSKKLDREDLLFLIDFMVKTLIHFDTKFISALNLDHISLSCFSNRKLRKLFIKCKFKYLYYCLGFIDID